MSRFIYYYTDFRYAECLMLNVVMLNVVILSVVTPLMQRYKTFCARNLRMFGIKLECSSVADLTSPV